MPNERRGRTMNNGIPKPPRGIVSFDFCQANGERARISAVECFVGGRSIYQLESKRIGQPVEIIAESENWPEIYARGREATQ